MSNIAIEKAKQIHIRHPNLKFPLDMEWLVSVEGCELVIWPFLEPIKEVKQGRWIGIADGLALVEQRFLIAHALAHHLLHCGNQLTFWPWQDISRRRQENEADCCAAHILIPEDEIIKIERLPVWEIAEHFGVPEELGVKRMAVFATLAEIARWHQ